jgi:hypothetical protein
MRYAKSIRTHLDWSIYACIANGIHLFTPVWKITTLIPIDDGQGTGRLHSAGIRFESRLAYRLSSSSGGRVSEINRNGLFRNLYYSRSHLIRRYALTVVKESLNNPRIVHVCDKHRTFSEWCSRAAMNLTRIREFSGCSFGLSSAVLTRDFGGLPQQLHANVGKVNRRMSQIECHVFFVQNT